ncbi:hypothetical protein HYW76_00970 [Candidatus Pacearchaeota archaeon]|nr:hypothetical protein [Candidatus Pacearchaeota archaeon]
MSSEKTREEYDKIAQGYSNSSKILTSNCILYPTLLKTLGDVSGLDIADLGLQD